MRRPVSKSLKDQYHISLWLFMAANLVVFYGVVQSNEIAASGFAGLLSGALNLLPVGLAWVLTTVVNGQVSAEQKARLVFLRWEHALPGHRAFTEYAVGDPRIDMAQLKKRLAGKIPTQPLEQNSAWYRFYKDSENDPAVAHVHRQFLFARDATAVSMIFFFILSPLAGWLVSSRSLMLLYIGFLILQIIVMRNAAYNYGIQFVRTVLARTSQKPLRAA